VPRRAFRQAFRLRKTRDDNPAPIEERAEQVFLSIRSIAQTDIRGPRFSRLKKRYPPFEAGIWKRVRGSSFPILEISDFERFLARGIRSRRVEARRELATLKARS